MSKVIFFEGPDGCGKTNIANAIADELDVPYFKVSTERSNWVNENFHNSIPFDMLLPEFVKQTGVSFISDRGYASEIVYSEVFDRFTDEARLWGIDREWGEMDAIQVIALRHDYSCVDDEFVAQEKLQYLHEKYVKFSMETRCHVISLHVDDYNDSLEEQVPVITKAVKDIWYPERNDSRPPGVSLRPKRIRL